VEKGIISRPDTESIVKEKKSSIKRKKRRKTKVLSTFFPWRGEKSSKRGGESPVSLKEKGPV